MSRSLFALALLSLLAVGPPVASQTPAAAPEPASVTLYREIGFRGASVTISTTQDDLRMRWPVRSVRVHDGVWELCRHANFRGRCTRYTGDDGSISSSVQYVQSVRPAGPA